MAKIKYILAIVGALIICIALAYTGLRSHRLAGPQEINVCIKSEGNANSSVPIFLSGIPWNAFFIKWIKKDNQKFLYVEIWAQAGKFIPVESDILKITFSNDNSQLSIYDGKKLVFQDSNSAYLKHRSFRNEGVGFRPIEATSNEGGAIEAISSEGFVPVFSTEYIWPTSFQNKVIRQGSVQVFAADCKSSASFQNRITRKNILDLNARLWLEMLTALLFVLIGLFGLPLILVGIWKSAIEK